MSRVPDANPDLEDDEALGILASGLEASTGPAGGACPEENLLAVFLDGSLSPEGRSSIEEHIVACPGCRRLVASISSVPGSGAAGESVETDASGHEEPALCAVADPCTSEFGPYSLRRRIGGGGMGVVYEAEHRERRRPEALKRIRDDLGADAGFAERFQREVRALARVSHDHIVPLYDSGCVGQVLYYTMRFLPGPSLARLLEEVRATGEVVPGAAALSILDRHGIAPTAVAGEPPEITYARRMAGTLAGPADALAALHAVGVLHRDVKPSNLVLDEHHRVVITDLGLAREEASRLTQTGEMVGTPAYMAPEQLRSDGAVDGRADVYGLGAVLFELWTLHAPHEGRSVAETLALVLQGEVRPARALNPRLPSEADGILARCLATRPTDRYVGAAALADDLRAFAAGEPVAARPPARSLRLLRRMARHKGAVAGAASLVLAVGAYAYVRPAHVTVFTAPFAEVAIDGERLGPSPIRARRLAVGTHRISLHAEGFADVERTVPLERGADYVLDVALRPLDPADSTALRRLAEALGVERTEVRVDSVRTPASEPAAAVLWPRGGRRDVPREVVLWALAPVRDVRLTIERVGDASDPTPVYDARIATLFQRTVSPLPDGAQGRIAAGGTYRVTLSGKDGRELGVTTFAVLAPGPSAGIDEEAERLLHRLDPADPARALLRADLLLSRGLFEEALTAAIALRERLGDRREVARIALAALDRAGLRDIGPWTTWVEISTRAGS
jgi:serine/threonine protein kinase